jgi:ankyrin repeat protein
MRFVQHKRVGLGLSREPFGRSGARRLLAVICLTLGLWSTPLAAQQRPVLRDNNLIEAARVGDLQLLETAYAAGVSVRQLGRNGQSALHVASQWGQPAAVAALLGMDVPLNKRARDGHTALSYAITFRHEKIVGLLLRAGADANRTGPNHEMPIIMAARLGLTDITALLLATNVMLDETDMTGRTAMDWARLKNHQAIMAQLREAGAR